jgi:tRNA(Ile)-lysidine synthase TilS/MesJ
MSKIYAQELEEKAKRVNYYSHKQMLSIPQDYFEDAIRQTLNNELRENYVDKSTCVSFCLKTKSQIEMMKFQMEQFREALAEIKSNAQEAEIEEVQELVVFPEEEATAMISKFIEENPGFRTSDIICELGIDPTLTLSILDKLQKDNKIIGKPVERK